MSRRLTLPGLLLFVGLLIVFGLLALFSRDNARAQAGEDTPTPLLNEATPVLTQTNPTATPDVLRITVDPAVSLDHFGPHDAFILHFSQPMAPESVLSALIVEPTMVGQETWSDYRQTLTFTPEIGYAANTTYTIRLHPDLLMADGAKLGGTLIWTLHTVSGPAVPSLFAPEWEIGDRQPVVHLTFDRLMDEASVAAALTVSPTIPFRTTWVSHTLTITPAYPLTPEQTYTFNLNQTATDQDGLPLTHPFGWEIHLPATLKDTGHLYDVDKGEALVFYFNYTIDPASFTLSSEPPLPGELSWNARQTVFSYTLTTRPVGDSQYLLTLEQGLRDPQGGSLPLPYSLFTMKTASRIGTVSPVGTRDQISTVTPITIQFKQPMDQASVAAAFQITPPISGTMTWVDNLFTFQPTQSRLAGETRYTVTLGPTATDAEGYPIQNAAYSWQFTTAPDQQLVGFGNGDHNQMVNARGRRAIQYSFAYEQEPLPVTFDLYALSLEQWLAGATGHYRQSWNEPPTPRSDNYVHIQETILPADLSVGIYRMDLGTMNKVEDHLFLFVSDNVLLVKQDDNGWLIWVATLDGTVVADAELRLYDANNQLLTSGRTDSEGLFWVANTALTTTPHLALAVVGEDVSLSYLTGEWQNEYAAGMPSPYTGMIYTDRPVYTPGQTVNFRAIVRGRTPTQFTLLPAGTPVTVQLLAQSDVYGHELTPIESVSLTTNDFGTVNGSFNLSNAAATGLYQLHLLIEDQTFRHEFTVQPVITTTHQLQITADAPIYVTGDEVNLTVTLRDAQGQPITNQNVTLQTHIWVSYFGCWDTLGNDGYWGRYWLDPLQKRTDSQGQITFSQPAEMEYVNHAGPGNSRHTTWGMVATAMIDGQELSQFVVWEVSDLAETVSLDRGESQLKNVGQAFPVNIALVDMVGVPVSGRNLTLTLLGYAANGYDYDQVIQNTSLVTGPDGKASIPYTIQQPGYYKLRVSGRDAHGHTFEASTFVYAYQPNYTGSYGPADAFTIEPERTVAYLPGETARFIVRTPFSGPALLTINGDHLLAKQVVQLQAPLTFLDLPAGISYPDDVYVTLSLWQRNGDSFNTADYFSYLSLNDGELRETSGGVRFQDPARQLNVTIVPTSGSLTPGSEATFTVRVTNGLGEPVSAELSLSLVDAALFTYYTDHTDQIDGRFYHGWPERVNSYHGMRPRRDLTWGGGFGGCGGGCGGEWFEPASLYAPFDTAGAWFPTLTTDANGEATVTLTLPANSTSWRLTAIATTADTQVGYSVFVVEQD